MIMIMMTVMYKLNLHLNILKQIQEVIDVAML